MGSAQQLNNGSCVRNVTNRRCSFRNCPSSPGAVGGSVKFKWSPTGMPCRSAIPAARSESAMKTMALTDVIRPWEKQRSAASVSAAVRPQSSALTINTRLHPSDYVRADEWTSGSGGTSRHVTDRRLLRAINEPQRPTNSSWPHQRSDDSPLSRATRVHSKRGRCVDVPSYSADGERNAGNTPMRPGTHRGGWRTGNETPEPLISWRRR